MYRNNIGKREVKSMYEIQKKEKKHYVHFVYYFIDESESTVARRERKKIAIYVMTFSIVG